MDEALVLDDLGFSRGETAVYFALFDLGETTVGPLSKKSGISHAKVYPILEKLIKKGLVSYIKKENARYYNATAPESLLQFVDKKKEELDAEKKKIQELLPLLKAKKKQMEKTQSSMIYEGTKGLLSLFRELFEDNSGEEILVLGFNELLERPEIKNFFLNYHDLRKAQFVRTRIIFHTSVKSIVETDYLRFYAKDDKIQYIDLIFPTSIFIFKNHVISVVVDERVTSYDVKSEKLAKRYVDYFNSIWPK